MKLSPYGEAVRHLRMRYDVKMKEMADFMGLSSSHLSGIEYGEKTLADRYVNAAREFFKDKATIDELRALLRAAERTQTEINVAPLPGEHRRLVAAFARRLEAGQQPTTEIQRFLDSCVEDKLK